MQRSTWLPSFYPYCIIITITIVLITGGARQSLTCVLLLVVRKTSTVGLSNLWYTIFVPYTISMIWCQTYDTLHGDTHDIVSNIQYTIFVPYTIHYFCTIHNIHDMMSNLWYTYDTLHGRWYPQYSVKPMIHNIPYHIWCCNNTKQNPN